jgi:4,5-DOPA dioxygenase extradiol
LGTLSNLKNFTDTLATQSVRMPVLFTSHGSPMDIPLSNEEKPFWNSLFELGKTLQHKYEIKAALIVSDYYGFPEEYYKVKYQAPGAPDIAKEIKKIIPSVTETPEWGLDHGAWPMLMHLFPDANIPVFQMSIDYYNTPDYHFQLGRQLKSLRDKGVLIIGSGSLIHNIPMVRERFRTGDMTPFGWEADYDQRNFSSIINYSTSHALGKLAAPTPDHFVPVLYSLGLMDSKDEVKHFYEGAAKLPAFSEHSFIIES